MPENSICSLLYRTRSPVNNQTGRMIRNEEEGGLHTDYLRCSGALKSLPPSELVQSSSAEGRREVVGLKTSAILLIRMFLCIRGAILLI